MEYSLEQLKAMASKLGMATHPNIGAEKLLERIVDEGNEKGIAVEELADKCGFLQNAGKPIIKVKEPTVETIDKLKNLTFSNVESKTAKIDSAKQLKEAERLIHCIVTSNDPTKTTHQGEMLCAGNTKLSGIKKFIPFNVPYMVPKILLNMLKEKKVQKFKEIKNAKGIPVKVSYTVPAYNIEILPDLTREEFEAIKQRQLADGMDKENSNG